jgi:hypothetical protein
MNAKNHGAAAAKAAGPESTTELRLNTARKRLAVSCDQQDALEGLREIVSTFLGSEEVGLFTVDSKAGTVTTFWSFGIDLENYDLHKALGNAGRERVMRGEYHVNTAPDHRHSGKGKLTQAFIPIRMNGRTVAILAILRLLPQKNEFDRSDFELFHVLTNEAGPPLFGVSLPCATGNDDSGIRA